MNELQRLFQQKPKAADFARGYLDYLTQLLGSLDANAIGKFAEALLEARGRGARIFFIGNGGSAATATHFANDIAIGTRSWAKPFRALSLTDNVSILTAIANDDGYDQVFKQQLQTQLTAGDLVVAISVSGNSPSVIRAVEYANAHGALTIGLTGFDGGELKVISQMCVHVPTNKGEYGPAEDIHMVLDHLVGAFLMGVCRSESQ